MSGYETFKHLHHQQQTEPQALLWNESAVAEAETWFSLFQSVPAGVLKRKMEEEAELKEEMERKRRTNGMAGDSDSTLSFCTDAADALDNNKKHWMPDGVCKVCYRCESPFSFMRRRHHCRVCGLVFCGDCSSNYVNGAQYGYSQFVRACDECYEQSFVAPTTLTANAAAAAATSAATSITTSPSTDDLTTASCDDQPDALLIVDEDDREVQVSQTPLSSSLPRFVKPNPTGLQPSSSSTEIFSLPRVSEQTQQAFHARESFLINEITSGCREEWKKTMIELCESVCDTVRLSQGDELNVLEYVPFQLLPGRTAKDSFRVNGAVIRKNVLHTDMPRILHRPRIMLLESALELQRGVHQNKLIAFEKLIEQERLYLELVVRKICSVGIDLLLCGGTISPTALTLLLERNITVASVVSKKDLKWISRLTGGTIIPTTESITKLQDPTGTCDTWRLESLAMQDNGNQVWDTFMFFEGAMEERGCTLVLRGEDSFAALTQVSQDIKSLLLQMWTIRLDHAFISCVDGKLPTVGDANRNNASLFGVYGKVSVAQHAQDLLALQTPGINLTRIHQFEQKQHNAASNSHMVTFQFYHPRKDRSFGEFLNSAFSKQNYTLIYLHGYGKISFSPVERLAKADVEAMGLSNHNVLTWANCRECGLQSSVCLVPPQVLHMSFGRFLQNCFYMQGLQASTAVGRSSCTHSLLHNYSRFFCRGELMLSMSFESLMPLEIQFADTAIDMCDNTWYESCSLTLFEELKDVCQQVVFHFSGTSCSVTASRRIEEIISKLEAVYPALPAPNEMNIVYRDLFLQCMEWNVWIQSDGGVNKPIILPPLLHLISSPRRSSFRNRRHANSTNAVLSRRPSLIEIQHARERILDSKSAPPPPPSGGGNVTNKPRVNSTTSIATTDSPKTPTVAACRTPPLRAPTIASNSPSTRAVGGGGMASFRKNVVLNKTLPTRLVEGHLLLPPGRRLGSAVVPVLEDEPTSWIAHALCSNHYSEKLQGLLRVDPATFTIGPNKLVLTPASSSEMVLTADEELFHIRSGFSDASEYSPRQCAFSVLSYFAAQFHRLRMLYMRKRFRGDAVSYPDEYFEKRFIDSLSRCTPWRPTGGKSTATFLKSLDGRFIIKSISPKELDTFAEIALQYFAHLSKTNSSSLLVPFLGIYSLTMQSEVVHGRRSLMQHQLGNVQSSRLLVAVMPNTFFNLSPTLVYDLKGNAPNRSRFVKNPGAGSVRLDWNFCQDNGGVPLALHPAAKESFAKAVQYDALFLASVGVVDYSLLVGVDSKQVAVGIIDYLQLYTIQKMLESTVKKLGQADPTVVSPNKYQARFVAAMERYFVSCGKYLFAPQQKMTISNANKEEEDQSTDNEEEDLSTTLVEQSILFQ